MAIVDIEECKLLIDYRSDRTILNSDLSDLY